MTTTDLDHLAQPRPGAAPVSQVTAVEQARAVAEVAAAVRVAQEFRRDETSAVARMRRACSTLAMADRAFYSLPRAGGKIEGSTVHLAREIAGCWGNIDYGIRELRRDDTAGESEMQAWAWDQETNVRSTRSFIVPHARMTGKGAQKRREALIDLGDIANNNNSVAARAVRETIFTVLPVWFRVEAEDLCAKTLQGGDTPGQPLAEQVAQAVNYFTGTYRITTDQLEARVDLPTGQWTPQTLGVLRVIDGELQRGEKRVEDHFPPPDKQVTAEDITQRTKPTEPATGEEYDPTTEPGWGERS
jgi:hypothetical protein